MRQLLDNSVTMETTSIHMTLSLQTTTYLYREGEAADSHLEHAKADDSIGSERSGIPNSDVCGRLCLPRASSLTCRHAKLVRVKYHATKKNIYRRLSG